MNIAMVTEFANVRYHGDEGKLILTTGKISFQPKNAPSYKTISWPWTTITSHQIGAPISLPSSKHAWSMMVNRRGSFAESVIFELSSDIDAQRLQREACKRCPVSQISKGRAAPFSKDDKNQGSQPAPTTATKTSSASRVAELKAQMAAMNAADNIVPAAGTSRNAPASVAGEDPHERKKSKIEELKEQMRLNSAEIGKPPPVGAQGKNLAELENIQVSDLRKKLGGMLPGKLRVPSEPKGKAVAGKAGALEPPIKKIDQQKKSFLESKLRLGPPPGAKGDVTEKQESKSVPNPGGPPPPTGKKIDKSKKIALESKLALQLKLSPPRLPPEGGPTSIGGSKTSAFEKKLPPSSDDDSLPTPMVDAAQPPPLAVRPRPLFLQELVEAVPEDMGRDVNSIVTRNVPITKSNEKPNLMGELQAKLLNRPDRTGDLDVQSSFTRDTAPKNDNYTSNSELADIPTLVSLAQAERRSSRNLVVVPQLASLSASLSDLRASLSKLQNSQSTNLEVAQHAAGAAAAAAAAAALYEGADDTRPARYMQSNYEENLIDDVQEVQEHFENELPGKGEEGDPSMIPPKNLEELNKTSQPLQQLLSTSKQKADPLITPADYSGSKPSPLSSHVDNEEPDDFAPPKLEGSEEDDFENEGLPPAPSENGRNNLVSFLWVAVCILIVIGVIVSVAVTRGGGDNSGSSTTDLPGATPAPSIRPTPVKPSVIVTESPGVSIGTIPGALIPSVGLEATSPTVQKRPSSPSGSSAPGPPIDTLPSTLSPATEMGASSAPDQNSWGPSSASPVLVPIVPETATVSPTFQDELGSPTANVPPDTSAALPTTGIAGSLPAPSIVTTSYPTFADEAAPVPETAGGMGSGFPTSGAAPTAATMAITSSPGTSAPTFVDQGSTGSPTRRGGTASLPPSVYSGTSAPQFAPTSHPTVGGPAPSILIDFQDFTMAAFENLLSPQSQARDWLLEDPSLKSYAKWKQTQRFALATFFFSFNGEAWPDFLRESWMQYDGGAECLWFSDTVINIGYEDIGSVPCNELGRYTSLGVYEITPVNTHVHKSFVEAFIGTIPPEVSLLTSLERILVQTHVGILDVTMPELLPIQLRELLNLTDLDLSHSYFREWDFGVISQLPSLKMLDLSFSDLDGAMPSELGLLTGVSTLDLSHSYRLGVPSLSSPVRGESSIIPTEIGLLSELVHLLLSGNRISGPFPTELQPLKSLEWLQIAGSQIQTFPPIAFTNLRGLEMPDNPIESAIPTEIGLFTSLQLLDLSSDLIVGRIPTELGLLTGLKTFRASHNALVHTIPDAIVLATSLTVLDLGSNILTGNIPSSISSISGLQTLNVDSNMLNGQIPPTIGSMANLTHLLLQYNDFVGTLPAEILGMGKLQFLDVTQNRITGRIATEIGIAESLVRLILDWNLVSGRLPSQVGLLSRLETFSARGYTLTGQIPSEMGMMASLQGRYCFHLYNLFSLADPVPAQVRLSFSLRRKSSG
jgi:Leucine-rich repeat (LRR) protein